MSLLLVGGMVVIIILALFMCVVLECSRMCDVSCVPWLNSRKRNRRTSRSYSTSRYKKPFLDLYCPVDLQIWIYCKLEVLARLLKFRSRSRATEGNLGQK